MVIGPIYNSEVRIGNPGLDVYCFDGTEMTRCKPQNIMEILSVAIGIESHVQKIMLDDILFFCFLFLSPLGVREALDGPCGL